MTVTCGVEPRMTGTHPSRPSLISLVLLVVLVLVLVFTTPGMLISDVL